MIWIEDEERISRGQDPWYERAVRMEDWGEQKKGGILELAKDVWRRK